MGLVRLDRDENIWWYKEMSKHIHRITQTVINVDLNWITSIHEVIQYNGIFECIIFKLHRMIFNHWMITFIENHYWYVDRILIKRGRKVTQLPQPNGGCKILWGKIVYCIRGKLNHECLPNRDNFDFFSCVPERVHCPDSDEPITKWCVRGDEIRSYEWFTFCFIWDRHTQICMM